MFQRGNAGILYAPVDQHAFYRRLFDSAIEVPGPHVEQLGDIARRHRVVLSVGVTEKGALSMGAMWNTNLMFDADGRPTVVIAEGTRRLLGNLFELEDLGLAALRGMAGPTRAWL